MAYCYYIMCLLLPIFVRVITGWYRMRLVRTVENMCCRNKTHYRCRKLMFLPDYEHCLGYTIHNLAHHDIHELECACLFLWKSCDSSVDIALGYGLDNRGSRV